MGLRRVVWRLRDPWGSGSRVPVEDRVHWRTTDTPGTDGTRRVGAVLQVGQEC